MCDNKAVKNFTGRIENGIIKRGFYMNDNLNWSSTGEQIKNAVTEALQSGDFKELNLLVSQTVTNVVNEVGRHVSPANTGAQSKSQDNRESFSENRENTAQTDIPIWQQRAQEREKRRQLQQQQAFQQQLQRKNVPALPQIRFKKIGNVSNVLYQVFGGIGLGITGLATLVRLLILFFGGTTLGGWFINFIFLAIFFSMVQLGVGQRKRLKRAERYLQLCDYRVYGEISQLAKGIGKNEAYVIRDLQKMIDLGIFPEGHLDAQKTCFMLNDVVYRQYLETENARRIREAENQRALETAQASQMPNAQPAGEVSREQESELHSMVAEGMEYIRKLRDLNDRIPGEVISAKLFCLENLLKEIFDRVKEHTEQMHRMHKLMNYYLPTTLKLVEAYEEFDRVSSPGEDIIKAKTEIENTLDTINQAFRELLNNLFQDAVLDATTDAQVLKTMLANEGLTREMEFATQSRT